jgi:TonB family protein
MLVFVPSRDRQWVSVGDSVGRDRQLGFIKEDISMIMATLRMAGLTAALTLAAPAIAAESELPSGMSTKWHVSLDAAGHVMDIAAASKIVPVLMEPLRQQIRQWQFVPGMRDGVPLATETTLVVDVAFAYGVGDEMQVSIVHAATGGNAEFGGRGGVPQYPARSLMRGEQGLAAVKVRYDGDGQILDIGLYEGAPKIPRALGDAAIAAVKHWRLTPEKVGDAGVPGELIVPVCFVSNSAQHKPDCNMRLPGLDRPAQANQALALNSVTGLATSVAGEVL